MMDTEEIGEQPNKVVEAAEVIEDDRPEGDEFEDYRGLGDDLDEDDWEEDDRDIEDGWDDDEDHPAFEFTGCECCHSGAAPSLGHSTLAGAIVGSVLGRFRAALRGDSGMSTVEYALGTIAAAAFGAVLYVVVTGDSIPDALGGIIEQALNTSV